MKAGSSVAAGVLGAVMMCAFADSKTIYVHHSGGVDPIFHAEIDSIRFSDIGLDSLRLPSVSVQEICTPDSVYRYNIADIDSVTFRSLPAIPVPGAIDLAGELYRYVEGVEYDDGETCLELSPETPAALVPAEGALLYMLDPSEKLPDGFAGRVEWHDGNRLYCSDVDADRIFTQLTWERTVDAEIPDDATAASVGVETATGSAWLAADNNYPDLVSGAIVMTDELRDIPAGPEEAMIRTKIRIQPVVRFSMGTYVIPGKEVFRRRTHVSVSAKVEAQARGRYNVKGEHKVGADKKYTFTRSLGLGQKYTLTYKGTLTLSGKMGLDYSYAAAYRSTASCTVTPITEYEADFDSRVTHRVVTAPVHRLDASMDGKLSMSGSLTVTAANMADSVKSISSTFVYGSSLSGTALFLNSQLADAGADNALYQRITATGIKAQPVESITNSVKYAWATLKSKTSITPTPATLFYAVPKFSAPNHDRSDNTITYTATGGEGMDGRVSRMGIAVRHADGTLDHTATSAVWPATGIVSASPAFDIRRETVYPTVTLCDRRILAAPAYPSAANSIYPVTSTVSAPGITLTSGATVIGTGTDGRTVVTVGNLFPAPVKKGE